MTIVEMIERINSNEKKIVSKLYNCIFVVRYDLFCKHVHYFFRTILKNFSIFVEKYDDRRLKNRHECDQKFLIDRLSETCQNRSLLETFAQSNCIYFCT